MAHIADGRRGQVWVCHDSIHGGYAKWRILTMAEEGMAVDAGVWPKDAKTLPVVCIETLDGPTGNPFHAITTVRGFPEDGGFEWKCLYTGMGPKEPRHMAEAGDVWMVRGESPERGKWWARWEFFNKDAGGLVGRCVATEQKPEGTKAEVRIDTSTFNENPDTMWSLIDRNPVEPDEEPLNLEADFFQRALVQASFGLFEVFDATLDANGDVHAERFRRVYLNGMRWSFGPTNSSGAWFVDSIDAVMEILPGQGHEGDEQPKDEEFNHEPDDSFDDPESYEDFDYDPNEPQLLIIDEDDEPWDDPKNFDYERMDH